MWTDEKIDLCRQRAQSIVNDLNKALIDAYIAKFEQRHEFERKIAELTAEVERLAKLVQEPT
jgi:archaellum component FlaC